MKKFNNKKLKVRILLIFIIVITVIMIYLFIIQKSSEDNSAGNNSQQPNDQAEYDSIIVSGDMLGTFSNGNFYEYNKIKYIIKEDQEYQLHKYKNRDIIDYGYIDSIQNIDNHTYISLLDEQGNELNIYNYIAFGMESGLDPKVQSIDEQPQAAAKEIVQEYLNSIDLKDQGINIRQFIEINFDGDNELEKLIIADNYNEYEDYFSFLPIDSYAIILFIDGDNVYKISEYIISQSDTESDYQIINKVIGVFDINGNNRYEFLIESSHYEGYSFLLYEFNNNNIELLLSRYMEP